MIVGRPSMESAPGGIRLRSRIVSESTAALPSEFWIEAPTEHADWLDSAGNAFVPFLVTVAGSIGERLVVEAPVCPMLLAGAEKIRRRFQEWWPDFSLPSVESTRPTELGRGVGEHKLLFFTRGLDSTFSVVRAMESPEAKRGLHLVYLSNILRHWSEPTQQLVLKQTKQAAERLGFPLIPLRTNALDFDPGPKRWFRMHGGLLASAALALGRGAGAVTIASTHDHVLSDLHPWGSHREIDPLWSTQWTSISQDGWHLTRVEKLQQLAGRVDLLRDLKVCQKADTPSNCGLCWKCVKTLCAFYVAGIEPPAGVFEAPLTDASLRRHWNYLSRFVADGPVKEELIARASIHVGGQGLWLHVRQALQQVFGARKSA